MRSQKVLFASLFAAGLAVPLASPAFANIVISVDKSTQRMLVAVDGQTRYDWPVSTGRAGYDTPSGVYKVNRMDAAHYSKQYDNAFMPDSMFFDLHGHAIHGFSDTPHLGMAVSHGCVRLSPANAAVLFGLVKQEGMENTEVKVSGRIPERGGPLVARRQVPTQEASSAQPMPIAPGYGDRYAEQGYAQQGYAQQGYAQRGYTQQDNVAPVYGRPAYGQRSYAQSSEPAFPPQPAPVYAYRRPSYQSDGGGYYQQPQGGGYYQQPSYGGYSRY